MIFNEAVANGGLAEALYYAWSKKKDGSSCDDARENDNATVLVEEQIKEQKKDKIKKCLLSGDPLNDNFELDAVYCAAYNIKDYYMESGNPR